MVASDLSMISSSFGYVLSTSSKYSSTTRLLNGIGLLHLGHSHVLMFRFAVRYTERSKQPQCEQPEPRAGMTMREKVCGSFSVTCSNDTNSLRENELRMKFFEAATVTMWRGLERMREMRASTLTGRIACTHTKYALFVCTVSSIVILKDS